MIVPNPNRPAHHGDSLKLMLAFAAIYLVWGSTYLAIRYAVETIPPLVTAGITTFSWPMYSPRLRRWPSAKQRSK